jgi:hypothetical protein
MGLGGNSWDSPAKGLHVSNTLAGRGWGANRIQVPAILGGGSSNVVAGCWGDGH